MSAPPSEGGSERLQVYHDGSCPLCRREIAHYARQRGADGLCFVDVSDPATALAPDLSRAAAMRRFHVRLADGRLVSGAAAFVAVWQQLPRWRALARLGRLPGVAQLLEAGYCLSLILRPRLARLVERRAEPPARR